MVVQQLKLLFGHSYKKTIEIHCSHKIQETEVEQEEYEQVTVEEGKASPKVEERRDQRMKISAE